MLKAINKRYRLIRRLSSRAVGNLYLARDVETRGRVVLKTVKLAGDREEIAAYYRHRYVQASRLNHPHLAKVLDFGLFGLHRKGDSGVFSRSLLSGPLAAPSEQLPEDGEVGDDVHPQEDEVCYFVLEHVPGTDLLAATGDDVDWPRLQGWLVQLLLALEYLHARGVTHHGVKPANILVGDDPEPWLKLSDLGLGPINPLTRAAALAEPPHYLAPELIAGQPVDRRADLYSVGVTLYQVIARKLPYPGTDPEKVARAHLDAKIPSLPARVAVPDGVAAIIARLLAKDPADRYPRARAVLDALAALEDGPTITGERSGGAERLLSAGFVGRRKLLSSLHATLEEPGPGCLLIEGPAGVGKTHLIRELSLQLGPTRAVSWGYCYPSPGLFHRPVAEVLWQIGQQLGWRGRLLTAFRDDLAVLVPHVLGGETGGRARPELTGGGQRTRLFENICRFLTEVSRERPQIVFIENVHLADGWGAQFLEHLIRLVKAPGSADQPTFKLVLTGRSGVRSKVLERLRGLALEQQLERVQLGPLDVAAVTVLVGRMLGVASPPRRFARRVHDAGHGNPLFVKELLTLLVEENRLFYQDGWRVDAEDPGAMELRGDLKEIVRARIRRLEERSREALVLLALIERPVSLSQATSLLRWDAHEVVAALHQLRTKRLLFEDSVGGELYYHFRHEQFRDVALEMLSSEEQDHTREAIFARMRDWPEAGAFPEEWAAFSRRGESGELHLAAGRRAMALGHPAHAAIELARADEALTRQPERRWVARARWAVAVDADGRPEEALRILQGAGAADETPSSDSARRVKLQELWLLVELGRIEEARAALEAADGWLTTTEDPLLDGELGLLRTGLDWVEWQADPTEGFDAALAALERAPDPVARARACERLLTHRLFLWGHPRPEVALRRAIDHVVAAEATHCLPRLLIALASYELAIGQYTAALERYQKALEAAEAVEDYRQLVDALIGLGTVFCVLGDAERARHYTEHASELGRRWADEQVAAHACFLEGRLEMLGGRTESALRTFEQAADWFRSAGAGRSDCYTVIATLTSSVLWTGHRRRAERWLDQAGEYRGQGYRLDSEGLDCFSQGILKLIRGDATGAVPLFRKGLEVTRDGVIVEAGWKLHYGLARARHALGQPELARTEIAQAEALLEAAAEHAPANLRETYLKVWFRQECVRYRMELQGDPSVQSGAHARLSTRDELSRVVDQYQDEVDKLHVNQLRELKGNLEKLLEINKKLNTELDVAKLLERIMDYAIELTRAERGVLLLAGPEGQLDFRVARDYQKRAISDPEQEISRSIAEQVIRDGQALVTTNAQEDQRLDEYQSVSDLRLHSVLCVPLGAGDGVLGALYIDNRFEKGVFNESDLTLLEAFADQAAIAVRNARLLEENRQRAESLAVSKERIEKLNLRLEARVEVQSAEIHDIREELLEKQSALELRYNYDNIVGVSPAMQAVFKLLDKVTATEMPVYIHGESGTGKELVSRAIHFNGPRRNRRFAVENCAALTETLLEAELFGHTKGAFTGADRDKKGLFEVANGGTIFFDEVGDMSHSMQKKLLRVLQEGEVRRVGGKDLIPVDVRIISASNKDLQKLVEDGEFREDLYYRLNVLRINLPPLRERREDLMPLVDHFLEDWARVNRQPKRRVTKDAFDVLAGYHWRGNIRELRNVVVGVVSLTDVDPLDGKTFADKMPSGGAERPTGVMDEKLSIEDYTIHFIKTWQDEYNDTELAKLLGVSRKTLWEKRKKYGIPKS